MKKNALQQGKFTIEIGTAIAVVGLIIGPVVAFFTAQLSTQKEIAEISERVVVVETFVPTIDKRLSNIEKALSITPTVVKGSTIYSE